MTSDDASLCECHLPPFSPVCSCCRREVDRVRGSFWHGDAKLCCECFSQWYDPDNESVEPTDPVSIGNYVRRKHGLPPLPE
jgi:hypothetical protein